MYIGMLKQDLCNPHLLVVILVVLTESGFRFSLFFSQLMAKAIPVRGAILEKPAQGNLSGLFAFGVLGFWLAAWGEERAIVQLIDTTRITVFKNFG